MYRLLHASLFFQASHTTAHVAVMDDQQAARVAFVGIDQNVFRHSSPRVRHNSNVSYSGFPILGFLGDVVASF
jgi:hypothetical protein